MNPYFSAGIHSRDEASLNYVLFQNVKKFPLLATHLSTQQEVIENNLSCLRQLKNQLNELQQSLWKNFREKKFITVDGTIIEEDTIIERQ